MKRLMTTLALATAAIPASAMAQATARLEWADPATIPPAGNSPQPIVSLTVYGENIPPVDGGHPDYRQYWHIFVRNLDPNGVASPWSHCDDSDGCGLYEFSGNLMLLQVDLRRWARVNGSTLQMRYYTGLDDPGATDPSVNTYRQPLSDWSNIWSWKVATVRVEAPPAPHPIILRARALKVIPVLTPPKGMMRMRPGMIGPGLMQQQGVMQHQGPTAVPSLAPR